MTDSLELVLHPPLLRARAHAVAPIPCFRTTAGSPQQQLPLRLLASDASVYSLEKKTRPSDHSK